MKWPRDEWLDSVMTSTLPPLQRLVAVVYSRRAGSNQVVWVSASDLIQDSGLSRNAARNALRSLVDAGWLELVERERQQRAARYRMTVPPIQGVTTAPPEGVPSEPPTDSGGHLRTRSGGLLVTPGGHQVTPGGSLVTPKYQELEEPPPTTPVSDLWLVVVDNLPTNLGKSLTRTRRLDDALARLLTDGWTPAVLAEQVRTRGWAGCQAGAVAAWLTNLSTPPPARHTDVETFKPCTVRGHEHSAVTANGCAACRFEHLGESA